MDQGLTVQSLPKQKETLQEHLTSYMNNIWSKGLMSVYLSEISCKICIQIAAIYIVRLILLKSGNNRIDNELKMVL